jgi:CO/xanthine dehydrogenase Mo-binding subunit
MLVAFAARELARPVRWVESRSENLSAAPRARDQIHRIALVATREGRLVALRDEAVMPYRRPYVASFEQGRKKLKPKT